MNKFGVTPSGIYWNFQDSSKKLSVALYFNVKTCGGDHEDIGATYGGGTTCVYVSRETSVNIFYHIKCKKSGELIPTSL